MGSFWAALGLGAIGGAGQAMGGMFQQQYQNEFTKGLLKDQYSYQSQLQQEAFTQSQENKNQSAMINAQQAGLSTPASIMRSASGPSNASSEAAAPVPKAPEPEQEASASGDKSESQA